MSTAFDKVSDDAIARFIEAWPLSWIVPATEPGDALLMPVMLECGADGRPARLIGHLPKQAAATAAFSTAGDAVFLMLGANAYIPPAWVSTRQWAPTWNFVSVKITADVELDDSFTAEAVERLVAQQEKDAAEPWSVAEMGARYKSLLSRIIGFRAHIRAVTPRFKTGQDETADNYAGIRAALEGHPLRDWMD